MKEESEVRYEKKVISLLFTSLFTQYSYNTAHQRVIIYLGKQSLAF